MPQPRGLEPSVTPLSINRWGISPTAPTLPRPEHRCYGTHLWDSFPVPLALLLQLSAQGQGAGTSVGLRGWTGVGGAAPIHFRTVKDHHCLPSHPVTYYYQTTGRHHVRFYVCVIPQKQYWMCGLGIQVAHAHFTSDRTLSHTNPHSPYTDSVTTTGASQQTYTSD